MYLDSIVGNDIRFFLQKIAREYGPGCNPNTTGNKN